MSANESIEIQQKIAYWVFEHAPVNWAKCCIYIELMPTNEKMENNWTTVWFDSNNKEMVDIEIEGLEVINMRDLFIDLNNAVAEINERWTTCKMKVTSDGKFSFDFGYDTPPHLMGSAEDLLYQPDYENF